MEKKNWHVTAGKSQVEIIIQWLWGSVRGRKKNTEERNKTLMKMLKDECVLFCFFLPGRELGEPVSLLSDSAHGPLLS